MKNVTTTPSSFASATECKSQALLFPELTTKTVTVNFEGGLVSSDGGGVLVARVDRSYGYLQRLATCFQDHRDPDLIEHELLAVLRQHPQPPTFLACVPVPAGEDLFGGYHRYTRRPA